MGAVVAGSPPPEGTFERVEQVGRVWVAWLDGKPWADSDASRTRLTVTRDHGRARILVDAQRPIALTVRETWDPGWKALLDGKPVKIQPKSAGFYEYRNSSRPA